MSSTKVKANSNGKGRTDALEYSSISITSSRTEPGTRQLATSKFFKTQTDPLSLGQWKCGYGKWLYNPASTTEHHFNPAAVQIGRILLFFRQHTALYRIFPAFLGIKIDGLLKGIGSSSGEIGKWSD